MEQYEIVEERNGDIIMINQGKYYNQIHNKHKQSYGDYGANNIRDNIMSTFNSAMLQMNNENMSNNMLLVGKVQSGKTSNLELFTALAFDNGFNLVVIYGGYDNTLLGQTLERFKKTFDIPSDAEYGSDSPVIFSSDDSAQILTVDNGIIEDLLDENKPIFLISMKRPAAMRKVNNLLSRIDKNRLKAFIIDDEGDQASLNTKKNKAEDASATYAEIVKMKDHLKDPLYLSVTATPQALIFLDDYSRLRPDSIRLIEPGAGYCGADSYHLYDSDVIEIIDDDDDQQDINSGVIADSLKNAIRHFLIASSIMHKRGKTTSDMIIHTHRNVSDHDMIYKRVESFIGSLKETIDCGTVEDKNIVKTEFLEAFQRFFDEKLRRVLSFDELWDIICQKILTRIYLILKNSAGQVTQANEKFRKHRIYIGGDLLQRGVTFSDLVTTYFTRWAKGSGNMDTNLQRARWFGYREKYIDICKIFTSSNIAREFTNLSEMEADLWEQFREIQDGEMQIDEILIRAENTKQKPTRKNVASFVSVSFKNKWIKQRVGIFSQEQVSANNRLVEDFIKDLSFQDTTVGRNGSDEPSAQYAIVNRNDLSDLINHMQEVFDMEPFERRPLMDLIDSSGDIPIILMSKFMSGRKRSFYPDNKIFALQQGADSKDPAKIRYKGDSYVVVDENKINIQIYKITPQMKKANGEIELFDKLTQYMFAIYVPKKMKYYMKG